MSLLVRRASAYDEKARREHLRQPKSLAETDAILVRTAWNSNCDYNNALSFDEMAR